MLTQSNVIRGIDQIQQAQKLYLEENAPYGEHNHKQVSD